MTGGADGPIQPCVAPPWGPGLLWPDPGRAGDSYAIDRRESEWLLRWLDHFGMGEAMPIVSLACAAVLAQCNAVTGVSGHTIRLVGDRSRGWTLLADTRPLAPGEHLIDTSDMPGDEQFLHNGLVSAALAEALRPRVRAWYRCAARLIPDSIEWNVAPADYLWLQATRLSDAPARCS